MTVKTRHTSNLTSKRKFIHPEVVITILDPCLIDATRKGAIPWIHRVETRFSTPWKLVEILKVSGRYRGQFPNYRE